MGVVIPAKGASSKGDSSVRVGVVSTRWNAVYVDDMVKQTRETLRDLDVRDDDVVHIQVPGAWEVPLATRLLCAAHKVDVVVCLALLVKGDTDHYEYIAGAVSKALMDVQLSLLTPVVFGVLCCQNEQQAARRVTGDKAHAPDWARTAVEMARLRKSQMGGGLGAKKSVGFF
ncbi:unnamed protein product [Agarophyton chilense]